MQHSEQTTSCSDYLGNGGRNEQNEPYKYYNKLWLLRYTPQVAIGAGPRGVTNNKLRTLIHDLLHNQLNLTLLIHASASYIIYDCNYQTIPYVVWVILQVS